jgi:hypothetical protein
MQHAQCFPQFHWTLLSGESLQCIAQMSTMVINVACGPMAYKAQLWPISYIENELLFFAME